MLLQVTVDKIYNVLLFVDGGWMVDVRKVSTTDMNSLLCFSTPVPVCYSAAH